jgi:hypothetical protein
LESGWAGIEGEVSLHFAGLVAMAFEAVLFEEGSDGVAEERGVGRFGCVRGDEG